MANVHAAIKEIRKSRRKRLRNMAVLSELHTLWGRFSGALKTDAAQAKALVETLTSKWDRAASKGIVPKGRADRKKARLANLLKQARLK